jgi:uncharacterized protein with LGFP repeats
LAAGAPPTNMWCMIDDSHAAQRPADVLAGVSFPLPPPVPVPIHGGPAAAIFECWTALGRENGVLGEQAGDVNPCPDGVGFFQTFAHGAIYWSPGTGAHEVHGAIRELWGNLGWERGFLGYPLTDETPTPDGVGRFNHFQGGSIYWTPQTGAHEVHGAIRELWSSLGWERGFLGYPLTDETSTSDAQAKGRVSTFQGGAILYLPATGAHAIRGTIPDTLEYDWPSITFDDGVAAGGRTHLTLSRDGGCHFTGAMHDSGAAAYNYSVAGAVKDVGNEAYTFGHTGNIAGTFESGSRDDIWDVNSTNPTVAQNWLSLVAAADGNPRASWSATVSTDLGALIGAVIGAVGTVAGVVALFV